MSDHCIAALINKEKKSDKGGQTGPRRVMIPAAKDPDAAFLALLKKSPYHTVNEETDEEKLEKSRFFHKSDGLTLKAKKEKKEKKRKKET